MFDLVNTAALLAFVRLAGVEDDAVAGLERSGEAEGDGLVLHARDFAEKDAALGAEAGVGEFLVVDALEPTGEETAGETHLKLVAGGLGFEFRRGDAGEVGHDLVEGLAVDPGDARDVFGRLEAAFDFQRGDSGADEVGEHLEAGEVLGAEEVAFVAEGHLHAVRDEIVGQAAGLGAFAAVGGAAAERLAGEALAGVGDAECAVDEDFQGELHLRGGLGGVDFSDVGEGIFAGEDDELGAEFAGEGDAGGARDRHLR